MFQPLDNLSHPGIPATSKLATLCLVSHQINRDIRKWVRTLMPPLSTRDNSPCRIDRQPKHPHYHPIVLIMSPLTFLGVYYVHVVISVYSPPLTISPGGRQLSQFRTLLQRLARTLISEWVSRFDVLTIITTHCGCEFESDFFLQFTATLGCTRTGITAYKPAAYGLVERFHRQL